MIVLLGTGTPTGCSCLVSTCIVWLPGPDCREAADCGSPLFGRVTTGGGSGVDIPLLLGGGVSTCELSVLGGGVSTCKLCSCLVSTCIVWLPGPDCREAADCGSPLFGCVTTGGGSGVDIPLLLGGGVSTYELSVLGGGVSTCKLCVLSPRPGGGCGTLCTSGVAGGGIGMVRPAAGDGLGGGVAGAGGGGFIFPPGGGVAGGGGVQGREAADAAVAGGPFGALRFGRGGAFEDSGAMSAALAGDTLDKCNSTATTLCASEILPVSPKCFPTRHVTFPGFKEADARARSVGLLPESKMQVASTNRDPTR